MSKIKMELKDVIGTDKADEIMRLTKNYDNYIKKFKKNINDLLNPLGYEVKTGIAFTHLQKGEKVDGDTR